MDPLAPGAVVESVAIKLPIFDPINQELWFVQCEAQFELKNVIVDQTKYYHIVAALDLVIQRRIKAKKKSNLALKHIMTTKRAMMGQDIEKVHHLEIYIKIAFILFSFD